MNFSQGQIIFGIVFFIVFVIAISFAFKMDKSVNKRHYEGSYKILLFLAATILFFWIFVRFIA
jgi:hypothetical protein